MPSPGTALLFSFLAPSLSLSLSLSLSFFLFHFFSYETTIPFFSLFYLRKFILFSLVALDAPLMRRQRTVRATSITNSRLEDLRAGN